MRLSRLSALVVTALAALPAAAQEQIQDVERVVVRDAPGLSLDTFLSTLVYGSVGILMCVGGYFVFDKIAGLNLKHELVEDQNTAVGIMLAGAFIGIAIVVASVMIS
jgi:hypothetical protein